MATKADTPYPGARKTVAAVSTAGLVDGKQWKQGQKDVEAQKYKPGPETPAPKGRDPVPTRSTEDAIGKIESEASKGQKYQDPGTSPWKVPDENKPKLKSTEDAIGDLEAEEAKAQKAAAEKKKAAQEARANYLATVQAQKDGTFKPPEEAPRTLAELKKTKDPAGDFAAGESVTVGGQRYTWTKASGWKPA